MNVILQQYRDKLMDFTSLSQDQIESFGYCSPDVDETTIAQDVEQWKLLLQECYQETKSDPETFLYYFMMATCSYLGYGLHLVYPHNLLQDLQSIFPTPYEEDSDTALFDSFLAYQDKLDYPSAKKRVRESENFSFFTTFLQEYITLDATLSEPLTQMTDLLWFPPHSADDVIPTGLEVDTEEHLCLPFAYLRFVFHMTTPQVAQQEPILDENQKVFTARHLVPPEVLKSTSHWTHHFSVDPLLKDGICGLYAPSDFMLPHFTFSCTHSLLQTWVQDCIHSWDKPLDQSTAFDDSVFAKIKLLFPSLTQENFQLYLKRAPGYLYHCSQRERETALRFTGISVYSQSDFEHILTTGRALHEVNKKQKELEAKNRLLQDAIEVNRTTIRYHKHSWDFYLSQQRSLFQVCQTLHQRNTEADRKLAVSLSHNILANQKLKEELEYFVQNYFSNSEEFHKKVQASIVSASRPTACSFSRFSLEALHIILTVYVLQEPDKIIADSTPSPNTLFHEERRTLLQEEFYQTYYSKERETPSPSLDTWFSTHIYPLTLTESEEWLACGILRYDTAAVVFTDIFSNLYKNAINYGKKGKKGFITLNFSVENYKDALYYTIEMTNPQELTSAVMKGEGVGLTELSKHLYQLNLYQIPQEDCIQTKVKKGIFHAKLYLHSGLFTDSHDTKEVSS